MQKPTVFFLYIKKEVWRNEMPVSNTIWLLLLPLLLIFVLFASASYAKITLNGIILIFDSKENILLYKSGYHFAVRIEKEWERESGERFDFL